MGVMSAIAADLADQQPLDEPGMEPQGPALPFSLEHADDDLVADFAAVGIIVRREVDTAQGEIIADSAARRAAVAATFLRLAAEADAEVQQLRDAMMAQVEIITTHYERLMASPTRRRDYFVGQVETLARLAAELGDFGKKKSAWTPFGDFGVKDRSASVALIDEAALVAHLKEHAPELVRVVAKLPLAEARQYLSETELAATKMEALWSDVKRSLSPESELPPGVEKVEAARVPFAKPMLPFTGAPAGGAK